MPESGAEKVDVPAWLQIANRHVTAIDRTDLVVGRDSQLAKRAAEQINGREIDFDGRTAPGRPANGFRNV